MIIIITIALLLSTPISTTLLKNTSNLAAGVHQKCLKVIPSNSEQAPALASLICGEKITDENLKNNLQKTSLLHIFIVSGSHLILLDELLSILKIPLFLRFLFLTFYSLCVGWQPPAVRALIGFIAKEYLREKKFILPSDFIVLITGFLTLILFPSWWTSTSLLMSWCAALALSFSSLLRIKNPWSRAVLSQFAVFLFMTAPLWGLGSLHPLSLVYNIFLAPVVSYVLLPLSFLAVFFSPGLLLFEKLIYLFNNVLTTLAEPVEITTNPTLDNNLLWFWVFSWHILFHFLRLHLWQGKDSV